jgi:cytochrome c-type biogenesis protein CcmF
MQDQRRGFRWWNMLLTLLSFLLVLFGTFTTRSGLIQSVHAFARSALGPYFLAAMGVTLVGSLALFYSRRSLLKPASPSDDILSREGMFTLTLILFLTITASVFVGSVLPTLTEAFTGQRFEAGPDWFDRVTGPQLAALVLVMGVCPLLGRAVGALRRLRSRGLPTVVGGLIVPGIAALAGFTRLFSLVGFAFVGLACGTALGEMSRGVAMRRQHGEDVLRAFWSLFNLNRRRYGGYLVHFGVILMAVGVIGTRFYPFETQAVLSSGESVDAQGYTLLFEGLEPDVLSDRLTTQASVSVYRDGRYLTSLGPRLDEYTSLNQTVAIPAIRAGVREDLYLVLAGWSAGGEQVTFRVLINPLASFLWLGGLVFLTGGAIAVWPSVQVAHLPASEARRRRQWNTAGLVVGIALLALAVWAMWGTAEGTAASSRRAEQGSAAVEGQADGRPRVGEPAPSFTVGLLDGSTLSLSELRGQVAVINFWSPDCSPCKDELPDLQAVWEEYRDRGVAFLGISVPELETKVRDMIADSGVTYPNALDLNAPVQYRITGVPETFVIASQGNVAYVHIGPVNAGRLREQLDNLLAE